MKKIIVSLSPVGINQAIKELDGYKRELSAKTEQLVVRLAAVGVQVAKARFEKAQYDGSNNVSVSFESRGSNRAAVIAFGSTALFIEFGTGVYYTDTHPEASRNGMERGTYGKGKGSQTSWGYYGDPGTNGTVTKSTEKGDLVITHGNPANMPMYRTIRELEQRFAEIAREVFGND